MLWTDVGQLVVAYLMEKHKAEYQTNMVCLGTEEVG